MADPSQSPDPEATPASATDDDAAQPAADAAQPSPGDAASPEPAGGEPVDATAPGHAGAAAVGAAAGGGSTSSAHWLRIRDELGSTAALGLFLAGILAFLLLWGFLTHSSYVVHPLSGTVGDDGRVVVADLNLGPENEIGSRSRRLQLYEPDDPTFDLEHEELSPNEFVVLSRAPLTLRYHERLAGEEVGFTYSTGDGPIINAVVVPPPGETLGAFRDLLVGPSFQVKCPNPECPSRQEEPGYVEITVKAGEALEAFQQGRMDDGQPIPPPEVPCPVDQTTLDGEVPVPLPGHGFRAGLLSTIRRTLLGFLAAVAICFPLGVLAGAFPVLKRFIAPLEVGGGYTPPVALLPLVSVVSGLLAESGMDKYAAADSARIGFIVAITSFWLYPSIVALVEKVDDVFVNTAYTCGASRWQVIRHVLIPVAMADIWESFRVSYAIGWALIILAEGYAIGRIAGEYGLGMFLVLMQRRREMDNFFAAVLMIIITAMVFDFLFKLVGRKLFPYRETD